MSSKLTKLGRNRVNLRSTMNKIASSFEQERWIDAMEIRRKRKEKTQMKLQIVQPTIVEIVGEIVVSTLDIYSHKRVCKITYFCVCARVFISSL